MRRIILVAVIAFAVTMLNPAPPLQAAAGPAINSCTPFTVTEDHILPAGQYVLVAINGQKAASANVTGIRLTQPKQIWTPRVLSCAFGADEKIEAFPGLAQSRLDEAVFEMAAGICAVGFNTTLTAPDAGYFRMQPKGCKPAVNHPVG